MNGAEQAEVVRALHVSADDGRLSRGERDALAELMERLVSSPDDVAFVRNRAFDVVRERGRDAEGPALLGWLEAVLRALPALGSEPNDGAGSEAHFSPGEACRARIHALLDGAKESADICVFTITDDSISERIVAAHRRGVAVRVITDDDKALDEGSDVHVLARSGVPLRTDRSEHHMHHKYAIFDQRVLLTGSYNWTRSAALYNRENLVVTRDPSLVGTFRRDFEALYRELGRWSSS